MSGPNITGATTLNSLQKWGADNEGWFRGKQAFGPTSAPPLSVDLISILDKGGAGEGDLLRMLKAMIGDERLFEKFLMQNKYGKYRKNAKEEPFNPSVVGEVPVGGALEAANRIERQ